MSIHAEIRLWFTHDLNVCRPPCTVKKKNTITPPPAPHPPPKPHNPRWNFEKLSPMTKHHFLKQMLLNQWYWLVNMSAYLPTEFWMFNTSQVQNSHREMNILSFLWVHRTTSEVTDNTVQFMTDQKSSASSAARLTLASGSAQVFSAQFTCFSTDADSHVQIQSEWTGR